MATAKPIKTGWLSSTKDIFRYVWRTSARAQMLLTVLAIVVFLLELAPLELQRRIVNNAVDSGSFQFVALLCGLYLAVALLQGGLKLVLNLYRGRVIETACKELRLEPKLTAVATSTDREGSKEEEGVAISIVTSEVDAVGGFVGVSFSDLVLNGGILLSVFGYMLVLEPWMALVALGLFVPQVLFIPILQEAINRRTAERIRTVRGIAVDIVDTKKGPRQQSEAAYRRRVGEVFALNMQIYRRKFGMTFLINLLHQLSVIGILFVGGWLLVQGKTEVGTVVAFISGLTRTNDPWNDLVDYFRNLTTAGVKYQLIEQVVGEPLARRKGE
jgi:ABC-type multidrug transport system fused ATPase/permease subunit